VSDQKDLRKVLIVSFYFSPINTIGSLRVSKLAKYLKDLGWEPWVLTVDHELYKYTNDLQIEIPEKNIYRADYGSFLTNYLKTKRKTESPFETKHTSSSKSLKTRIISKISSLFQENRFPDRYLPWYLPAYRKGILLSKKNKFDVVLSSFSPPASHIVAYFIAKKYKIPWVADYRDLWTKNHDNQRSGILGYFFGRLEITLEKYLIKKAFSLITVSEPLKIQLINLHNKSVNIITNGYDHEDYDIDKITQSKNKKITIVYTGNIYKGKQSPEILFLAINNLISKNVITKNEFEIHFYGTNPQFIDLSHTNDFKNSIKFHSRISQKESIDKQIKADILLLLQWNDPNVKGFYSGKVFEYLGAKKPILAVGIDGGVISELLKETKAGYLATSALEAESILFKWVTMYKSDGSIKYSGELKKIHGYTRFCQAKKLALILDEASKK
jgi:hypothetical protein